QSEGRREGDDLLRLPAREASERQELQSDHGDGEGVMAKRSYSSNRDGRRERKPQTFELDGVEFVATGSVSMLDISGFARLAAQGVDSDSPEAVAFLADTFRALLGDQEYHRFREHCRRHDTDAAVLVE